MSGGVVYLDHMGSDLTIANVARVSLGRSVEELGESEERLIAYLLRHRHTSPLRHCFVSLHLTAPIFVLRQWAKHTVGCAWNEISYRYVQHDAERAPVWTPDAWRESAPGVKQGSGGELKSEVAAEAHGAYQAAINDSIRAYTELLARGVCREQARAVLPQGPTLRRRSGATLGRSGASSRPCSRSCSGRGREHNVDNPDPLTHLSLCAGYGGLDLGIARALGPLRTVAFVEIEAFACANLVAKMEEGRLAPAPIWTDLKTFDWSAFRGKVDVLSGGFPCQPFSSSGIRRGDEDPRHLWPHITRGIGIVRPALVLMENVEGILSAKLKGDHGSDPAGTPVALHVLRELERLGYRAEAGLFSAEEVGAPHQRRRCFFMAISNSLEDRSRIELSDRIRGALGGDRASISSGRDEQATRSLNAGDRWPARRGEAQFDGEPPRVLRRSADLAHPVS